jgi:phage terminase large subunit GpA-like protein
LLANRIVYDAVRMPGRAILVVCPRIDQASMFSRTRLHPLIQQSPLIRRLLWPRERCLPVHDIELKNGSWIHIRSAFRTADAARGISADTLVCDEFQDLAPSSLPILRETMSHSNRPYIILAGTPKWIENPLESEFQRSTACEWHVACPSCTQETLLGENTLGMSALICPKCQAVLNGASGHWIARNPDSTYADGFALNHMMVCWLRVADILERQQTYDRVTFLNEVLGLPATLGDHIVTREEMEACCENRPFVQSMDDVPPETHRKLVMGVDWGGGSVSGTVAVIGYAVDQRKFRVLRFDRWRPHEDPNLVARDVFGLCKRFRISSIAADGSGNGSVYNSFVFDMLKKDGQQPRIVGMHYSEETQDPRPAGAMWKWIIGKTPTIGGLFSRVKMKLIQFPRATECGSFLDEFTCVLAEYDDDMRAIRYTKPDDRRDDAMHALNYGELLALRLGARQFQ